jgi:hypothetical protein
MSNFSMLDSGRLSESELADDDPLVTSATKIQALFRGYLYRKHLALADLYHYSAKVIQAAWRKYLSECKCRNVRIFFALFRINRVVQGWREKLHAGRYMDHLRRFDPILTFYPAKSNPPTPRGRPGKERRAATSTGNGKDFTPVPLRLMPRARTRFTGTLGSPSRLVDNVPRMASALGPREPSGRRRVLVDLPPPWHEKDPKRMSQTQRDDALYVQRGNIAWVKENIIAVLMRGCAPKLQDRDDLLKRNRKHLDKVVEKPFVFSLPRVQKSLAMKQARDACILRSGLTVFASTSSYVMLGPTAVSADNIRLVTSYDVKSPMIDIAIHPLSGNIVALDARWTLRLIENGKTVLTRSLSVGSPIPRVREYLAFDRHALLWVNLFPQRGSLLLVDPLTFETSLQFSLDQVCLVHRFMRMNVSLTPFTMKDHGAGFIGLFAKQTAVYLFSYDFAKVKILKHEKMRGFPKVKQENQRIFVWSTDKMLYIYELGEILELTTLVRTIGFTSIPRDIVSCPNTDFIFVACEDSKCYVLLGKSIEVPLRIPNAELSMAELSFASVLLGPMVYAQSRVLFAELACVTLTAVPVKLCAFRYSEKLILLIVAYESGNMGSFWLFNVSSPVKTIEFETFNLPRMTDLAELVRIQFDSAWAPHSEKIEAHMALFRTMSTFTATANSTLMTNRFHPSRPPFSLAKMFINTQLRPWHLFFPSAPNRTSTCYEVYHFFTRTGMLPMTLSTFSTFLERFAPESLHRALPAAETLINPKIPMVLTGPYKSVVDLSFSQAQLTDLIEYLNPVKTLFECVGQTTSLKHTSTRTHVRDGLKFSSVSIFSVGLTR